MHARAGRTSSVTPFAIGRGTMETCRLFFCFKNRVFFACFRLCQELGTLEIPPKKYHHPWLTKRGIFTLPRPAAGLWFAVKVHFPFNPTKSAQGKVHKDQIAYIARHWIVKNI